MESLVPPVHNLPFETDLIFETFPLSHRIQFITDGAIRGIPAPMRNRRDRRLGNKIVVHITSRVIEGLPFVAWRSLKQVVESIIARGQELYPVRISALNSISPFMGYIEGEIALAFKEMLPGKYQSRLWSGRYHE